MARAKWGDFGGSSCDFCGETKSLQELVVVKMTKKVLLFCREHPWEDSCAQKVARQLVDLVPAHIVIKGSQS